MARVGERRDIAVNRYRRPRVPLPTARAARRERRSAARQATRSHASHPERRERLDELGIVRFVLPPTVDIPALVTRLRAPQAGRVPRVGPNHVLAGEPAYQGGPAGRPDRDRGGASRSRAGRGSAHARRGARHRHLAGDPPSGSTPGAAGRPPTPRSSTSCRPTAGSTTRRATGRSSPASSCQRAPSASVDVAKVLDSEGYGDEIDDRAGDRPLREGRRHQPLARRLQPRGHAAARARPGPAATSAPTRSSSRRPATTAPTGRCGRRRSSA